MYLYQVSRLLRVSLVSPGRLYVLSLTIRHKTWICLKLVYLMHRFCKISGRIQSISIFNRARKIQFGPELQANMSVSVMLIFLPYLAQLTTIFFSHLTVLKYFQLFYPLISLEAGQDENHWQYEPHFSSMSEI